MLRMLRSFTLLGTILAALVLAGIASAEGGQPSDLPVGGVPVGDTVVYDGGQLVTGVGPFAFGDCTGGRFCLWDLQGYAGEWVYKTSTGWYNLTSFDNRAESARNNTGWQGKVATGYNGSGSQQTHNAGGYFYSLGSVFNNQVSSYCLSSC